MSRVAFLLDEIEGDDGPAAPTTLRARLEDLLPLDCLGCGWEQPGPHEPKCKLAAILDEIQVLDQARPDKRHGILDGFASVEEIEQLFGWPARLLGCRVAFAVDRGQYGIFMVFQDPDGGLFEVNASRGPDGRVPWSPGRTSMASLARRQSSHPQRALMVLQSWGVT